MILLISYDLLGHERPSAYEAVKEVIEGSANSWKKPLYSQWFVETTDTVETWSERLKEVMDKGDKLLVIKVQAPYQGWLPKEIWPWLKERV
ncbi:hypothetical protein [Nocardioides pocheonensis]|jgi:hypothetical protein|uniref:SinR family protein n=1 Tax=Nocardioides pocheonensis TaxID=661485 RepID=A0A3N0GGZ0_9ACTN|nr:hypothetical protein [Nocardioides pocheonensis]RNM11733.1 hypothetical protein EFL26_21490 [Nocardioides pocheonensis]